MAGEQNVGSIVYEVSADIAPLLQGAEKAKAGFDKIEDSANSASQGIEKLDKSSAVAGASLDELTGYVKSIDASMKAVRPSIASASESLGSLRESASEANASLQNIDKSTSQASGSLSELNASSKSIDASLKQINTNLSALTMAMQTARNATGSASAEFNNAERVVESLSQQVQQLDKAQEAASNGSKSLTTQIESVASAGQNASRQVGTAAEKIATVKNSAEVAAKSTGNFKSAFQQAGYQVQDFIVQVQGGQSALVAFSQQGSQLAGAFGPGGAVLGAFIALGTVLTGVLMSALGNTSNEMEKLEKAAEQLNKIVVINSQGVAALSNDYARLAATNATLATQLRDNAIQQYEIAVRDAGKAIQGIVNDQSSWFGSLSGGAASVKALGEVVDTLSISTDSFRDAFKQASAVGIGVNNMANTLNATVAMLSDEFEISDDAAFGLAKRLNELAKNPSPQAVSELVEYINSLSPASRDGADALSGLEKKILDAGAAMQSAQDNADALKKRLQELRTEAQQANFDNVSKQLEAQRIALTKGRQAAVEYGISQQDLTQEQKDQLIQQSRVVNGLEEDKKAREEAERAAKRQAAAGESVAQKLEKLRQEALLAADSSGQLSREQQILNAQLSLGPSATEEQRKQAAAYKAEALDTADALKKQEQAEKDKQNTEKAYQNIRSQSSPLVAADNTYQQQMASLNAYAQLYPQKIAEVEQTRATIEEQYRQQRLAAMWDEFAQQNAATMAAAAAFDSLAGNASNALTGILTGSMSVNEALASLGRTILNSVINSFVQIGVEYAKNLILQQTLGSAAIAATSAQAAAAAAAWATPAALAATATLGGAAVAGQAALATAVGSAQVMALAGARKNGGPVSAGSMYRVGEGGMPEIYQASTGKQYMIPGDNGRVISNKDMQAGNGMNVVVNFNDYSSGSHSYDYQATQDGNTLTVEAFIADMSNGGRMSQSISNYHNAPRRARGE